MSLSRFLWAFIYLIPFFMNGKKTFSKIPIMVPPGFDNLLLNRDKNIKGRFWYSYFS